MKWFEKYMNKMIPKIESSVTTDRSYNEDQFRSLVMKLHRSYSYDSSENPNEFVLNVPGNFFSKVTNEEDHEKLYSNTKSKLLFTHLENGKIKISSFEHIMASKKEKELYRQALEKRLNTAVQHIYDLNI